MISQKFSKKTQSLHKKNTIDNVPTPYIILRLINVSFRERCSFFDLSRWAKKAGTTNITALYLKAAAIATITPDIT